MQKWLAHDNKILLWQELTDEINRDFYGKERGDPFLSLSFKNFKLDSKCCIDNT